VDVVPVERDVELAERDLVAGEVGDAPAQALRERNAARVDADERDRVEIRVSLDDLVRDPRNGALDRLLLEDDLAGRGLRSQPALRVPLTIYSFPASRDRVKGVRDRAGV
jgi:hypothetical protein